jgi:Asp-tRNA(Asn)/Glu-tRNA(Gln) amidotransferase C subunit
MKNITKNEWKTIAKKIFLDLDEKTLQDIEETWHKLYASSFEDYKHLDIQNIEPTDYCHRDSMNQLREDVPHSDSNKQYIGKKYFFTK